MPAIHQNNMFIPLGMYAMLIICTTIAHADIPESVLPDAYTGTATMEINYGSGDGGWKIGSQRTFSIANDWEFFTSGLYHGKALGYSTTNYNYSTKHESFRYDLQSGVKNVGMFPDGLIDRDLFLSPKLGYELLKQSDQEPINTDRNNSLVYVRNNPLASDIETFIAVDPNTSEIQWIETKFDDGTARTKFLYSQWKPLKDGRSVPHLIQYDPDTIGGIRLHITDVKIVDSNSIPQPNDLGPQYTIYDYKKMNTYDANGTLLGPIVFPNDSAKTPRKIQQQTLFIGAGILLVLISGIIIAKKRAGH